MSAGLILGHELVHAYVHLITHKEHRARSKVKDNLFTDAEERDVIRNFENPFAQKLWCSE